MPTRKLFRYDPMLEECDAQVTSVDGNKLTLDQTVLFAFAGGQASDTGTIGGIPTLEAAVEGDEIVYTLESEPGFSKGDTVRVKLDMGRRKTIMRLHSAAHLVYCLFNQLNDTPKLIGSNVSLGKSRLDYEYPESIKPQLPELEEKVNEFFSLDTPIRTFPDEKNPGKWWWECGDWKIPCGGTHVSSAREIGPVKLKRRNIGAGKERIEITLR